MHIYIDMKVKVEISAHNSSVYIHKRADEYDDTSCHRNEMNRLYIYII